MRSIVLILVAINMLIVLSIAIPYIIRKIVENQQNKNKKHGNTNTNDSNMGSIISKDN